MSSSSKISLKIVVAYWPGDKKNVSSRVSSASHRQASLSGFTARGRRSGFIRVTENRLAKPGVCATMSRSRASSAPEAVVPPSPHKGPVAPASAQLPSFTRAASTSLNSHERAAEKYNTFFEPSLPARFLPPRPFPADRLRRFRMAGSRCTARSRFAPPLPNRWGPK